MAKLPTRDDLGPPPSARTGTSIARLDLSGPGRAVAGLGASMASAVQTLADHEESAQAFDTERRFQEFKWNQQLKLDEAMRSVEPGQAGEFASQWADQYRENARQFFQSVPDSQKPRIDQHLFAAEREMYSAAATFSRTEQKRSSLTAIDDARTNIYFPRASTGEQFDTIKQDFKRLVDANPYLTPVEKDQTFRKGVVDLEETHIRGRLERGEDINSVLHDIRGGVPDTKENPETRLEKSSFRPESISTRLETGKDNPLEGVSNISGDSAGTKSYGNFGLNSGGSAQKFVAEYGDKFGLTAKPGTPEFDVQWRDAAARSPDKLHAAEMEWYDKNIVSGISKRLVNAGVSEELANDPRVKAYFADRSVQQGAGSIDEVRKHSGRIKAAADEAGNDAVKFLTAMTEADRGALESDFPTALRSGVYSERGHDTRLNGRLSMALSADGGDLVKESAPQSFTGPYQHLSPDQRFALMREAKTAYHHEVAVARESVKAFESAAEKGYAPPAAQIEALRTKVTGLKDPETAQAFRQAEAMMQWQSVARQARPEELDAFIRNEAGRLHAGGATPFEIKRVEMADKLLNTMRQELKEDPLGWAERVEVTKIVPIDFSTPEATKASLAARTQQVDEVAKRYGQAPRYLRPDEKQSLVAAISQGGDQTLSVATAIASGAGSRAPAIMGEIFHDSPTAAAMIGGLVAETGTIVPAARDAADAMVLAKQKDFKPLSPPQKVARSNAMGILGTALSGMPKLESAMIASADLVYETRARRAGLVGDVFDSAMWQQALKEIAGERTLQIGGGSKTYGGIVDADPSWWGNRRIVLPPDVSQDDWRQIIDSLTSEDLTSTGSGLPAGADGKPIPLSRAKGAILVQTGSGRYALSLGNPDTPGQEQWIVRSDDPNKPFELDFAKLKPVMQKRYPGLYLGESAK